jgi:hypothetical protein
MAVPSARTNQEQTSWNKHKTGAVLKSMNDSIQRPDQAIVAGQSQTWANRRSRPLLRPVAEATWGY